MLAKADVQLYVGLTGYSTLPMLIEPHATVGKFASRVNVTKIWHRLLFVLHWWCSFALPEWPTHLPAAAPCASRQRAPLATDSRL